MSVETLNIMNCNTCSVENKTHMPVQARLSKLLVNASKTVYQWIERDRSRRQLAQLDDRMLQDIGLNRSDIELEIEKPFWDR